ncbi:MAG: serine/threonine-protein kinase, partial [Candidatus Eremiobacterota bacterium]
LTPRADLASRWHQLTYLIQRHRAVLGLCLVGVAVAGWLGARRWARLRRALQRAAFLDSLAETNAGTDAPRLTRLGRYRMLERIGRGGMGEVYRALSEDSEQGETVAVKVMNPELAETENFRRRFQREIKILCGLNHPNVVRILDWGDEEGAIYMVMELLEGESLQSRVRPTGSPLAEVVAWARQASAGLAAAHQNGIVHRDIKPENLFLTRSGLLKVTDFGISRGPETTRVTRTGYAMGTPTYMAPEHVQEGTRELDPLSDQYSLGIVLYELLAGKPPFVDPDPFAVAFMHAAKKPPSLCARRPDLPRAVEKVIFRMLEKEPQFRYPSVEEAARGLEEAAAE